jgi:hypothetical protein
MSAPAAGYPAGSTELRLRSLLARLERLRGGTAAMGWAELRKLRHDHLDIFTRSVQPLLWLFIFGTALRQKRALRGGADDYRAYLAPGVMAQAALFSAIFFGLAVIWEATSVSCSACWRRRSRASGSCSGRRRERRSVR